MDFFAQQDHARRQTKWLIGYFAIAVALMIVTVYITAVLVFAGFNARHHQRYDDAPITFSFWNPQLLLGVGLATLAIIFCGSAWKTSQLSSGGGTVATLMGGRRVAQTTGDTDERKLLNVVEEMSIASGVPMPQVYVLENEEGINAFAAGHSTGDAAIGVTRGCIRTLSRDELQGVIGHEFSHILNGDMKLNLRLLGILFGILCLATTGRILLQTRGGSRDKNPLLLFGIALLIIGSIGVFFGRLIQSAVSRQREFLADASSVQFTRNPGGLSGALQKIGRYSFGSKLQNEHAPDLCHMFFSNGLNDPLMELMATHPPIDQRIRAIDPQWDGKYPPLKPEQFEGVKRAALNQLKPSPMPEIFRTIETTLAGAAILDERVPPVIRPDSVLPSIGKVTPLQLKYAEQLRDALPDDLKTAARDPLPAAALIFALLLSAEEQLRATQISQISRQFSETAAEQTRRLFPDVARVAARARLPLVNLALGALSNLSRAEFNAFSKTLAWLVESDGKIELFEFILQKIILRHLAVKFTGTSRAIISFYTLKPLVPDCAVILSALAYAGNDGAGEAQHAFLAGAPHLRAPLDSGLKLLPPAQCGVKEIDAALTRIGLASPIIKKNLLAACIQTLGADGVIRESEAELLRGIADTLDCPMPPLISPN